MIIYKKTWGVILLGIMILLLPQSCNNLEEKETAEGPDLNKPKKKEIRFEIENVSYLKDDKNSAGAISEVREQPVSYRSKVRYIDFKDGSVYLETIKMKPANSFVGQIDIPEGDYANVSKTTFFNHVMTTYDKQGRKLSEVNVPSIPKLSDPIITQARKQSVLDMIEEAKRNGATIVDIGNGLIKIKMNGTGAGGALRTDSYTQETQASNILMDNVVDVNNQLVVATTFYAEDGGQLGFYAYNYQVIGGELALSVVYQEMNTVINVPSTSVPEGFIPVTTTQVNETRFANMEVIY